MYPDSALSAGQLAVMAVVIVVSLAAWLIVVFLAARQPRDTSAAGNAGSHDEETAVTATQLHSDARPAGKAAARSGAAPPECTRARGQLPGRHANTQVTNGKAGVCQPHDHLEV